MFWNWFMASFGTVKNIFKYRLNLKYYLVNYWEKIIEKDSHEMITM